MSQEFDTLSARVGEAASKVVKLYQAAERTGFDRETMAAAAAVLRDLFERCLDDEQASEALCFEVLAEFERCFPAMLAAIDAGKGIS